MAFVSGNRVWRRDPGQRAVHRWPGGRGAIHPQDISRGLALTGMVQVPAAKVGPYGRGRGLERVPLHEDAIQVPLRRKVSPVEAEFL